MINVATSNLISTFTELERQVAEERGEVLFFALVRRDDQILFNAWDLIVAAPWASVNIFSAIEYIAEKIKTTMDMDTRLRVARIVPFEADDPKVQAFAQQLRAEHGKIELRNTNFFGVESSEVYAFVA